MGGRGGTIFHQQSPGSASANWHVAVQRCAAGYSTHSPTARSPAVQPKYSDVTVTYIYSVAMQCCTAIRVPRHRTVLHSAAQRPEHRTARYSVRSTVQRGTASRPLYSTPQCRKHRTALYDVWVLGIAVVYCTFVPLSRLK